MRVKRMRVDKNYMMKQMEMTIKMLINTKLISKYRSVYKGRGLEFEDYRVYTPDDDANRIDWKASMRTSEILIKMFKEERHMNVYVMLDTSSSMIFGSTEKLKLEYAAEFAAAFLYFALEAGDKAGLVMFNDRAMKSIPPSSGKKHFYIMLNSIANPELYGGGADIEKAINFVVKTSSERGLLMIISDFIGKKGEWQNIIRAATAKFDVIGVMVRDPRDEVMPEESVGQVVLQDPYSDESVLVNSKKIGVEYGKFAAAEEKKVSYDFVKERIDMIKLSTDQSFIKPLVEYFMVRRRIKWR